MPALNLPGILLDRAHPLARGLVGWWPMNEGGGTRASDVTGVNHGTLIGSSVLAGGPRGHALYLNNTAAQDKYVTTVNSPSTNFAGDFTVACSAKAQSFSVGNRTLLGKRGGGGSALMLFVTTGGALNNYDGSATRSSGYTMVAGVVYHVAMTRAATTLYFYINGALVGTSATSINSTTDPFQIGNDGLGECHDGWIWGVRLYNNRALSASEVAQLYADPLAGALAPSRAARYYVAATISPPIAAPPTADRLWNRIAGGPYRRGVKP